MEQVIAELNELSFVNKDDETNPWETDSTIDPLLQQDPKATIEEELAKQSLYKTELCRSFMDTGACRYGHKCQFAHGEHEIRPVLRHPKYKTELCKRFTTTGSCPYGFRCRFIHPKGKKYTAAQYAAMFLEHEQQQQKLQQQQQGTSLKISSKTKRLK